MEQVRLHQTENVEHPDGLTFCSLGKGRGKQRPFRPRDTIRNHPVNYTMNTARLLTLLLPAATLAALVLTAAPARTDTPGDVLRLPARNAYSEPDGEAVRFPEDGPATGWRDGGQRIAWYGDLRHPGALKAALALRLPAGQTADLRLTLTGWRTPGGKETRLPSKAAKATSAADGAATSVDFGTVEVPFAGYWRFALEGVGKSGETFGQPEALTLSGPAAKDANVNRSKWRSPASVHLGYPLPEGIDAEAAYCEVKATADPIHTYYCALGFRRGYFGMQVNGPAERRIIFSVWDAGGEPVDPKKVGDDDRVKLIAKGEGVFTDRFGNEGTGGHSHLKYRWKTGETQRFLVTAKPDGTGTIYSGYFFFPETKRWGLIASFRAPKDGAYLRGLYSFNEVFGGDYGQLQRRAEFGRQFARGKDGKWTELTSARFTHTGKDETTVRRDWGGGVTPAGDTFYLVNGGFLTEKTTYADALTRMPSKQGPPADITLPEPTTPP